MIDDKEHASYERLRGIVAKLRAPDGCPWDREQTHDSLRHYLIEEAYEVVAALDDGDMAGLPEELGDLLFQILLHTQLAEENGDFSMGDVIERLADKLVRRHPHVFGEVSVETPAQVVKQWDELKQAERGDQKSAVASVPRAMPALSLAQTLVSRAAKAGFAWPDRRDVLDKVAEEIEEISRAESKEQRTEEFGDLLLSLASYAEFIDVDAEEALRLAARKFRGRFEHVESAARTAQRPMKEMSPAELLSLWAEAKALDSREIP